MTRVPTIVSGNSPGFISAYGIHQTQSPIPDCDDSKADRKRCGAVAVDVLNGPEDQRAEADRRLAGNGSVLVHLVGRPAVEGVRDV